MRTCESVTDLARELGVRPRCLYKWRAKLDLLESGEESAPASTDEGFYRSLKEQRPAEEETEVRSAIQQIALEHRRRYGYRRICAELRRRGMQVNHKRVLRMMRRDNLLALRRRRFVVTTNSNHKFEVY